MTSENKTRPASAEMFRRGGVHLPGAVNSPVRAFKAVGGVPPFIESAHGAIIRDIDGNEFIDYVMSYGPLLFGHAYAPVVQALCSAAAGGTVYGAPTVAEVELAELVCHLVSSVDMVRFVNSGSEATTSALRLARGATGRSKILKCAGCFHGSVDALLVKAGSGMATLAVPDTAGVPASIAAETIVIEYNDVQELERAFSEHGSTIAAFILEPIAANMGVVPATTEFLEAARRLTASHGAVLIFDEVISGFRVAAGGAQALTGIEPDLTCFGKIVGGGVPCGAYGGRREIMEQLAPLGPVYQAGTLSGNPLAMQAGLATLREIASAGRSLYAQLDELGARLQAGLQSAFAAARVPASVQRVGSIVTPFFAHAPVTNYAEASACDTARFAQFFHGLLDRGVYVPPSQFEAWFVSNAHTPEIVDHTIVAVSEALASTP